MYLLKIWNGKYGNGAKFIVENKSTGKYSEFSPVRPSDLAWVDKDLTKESEYKNWESFENEPVEDLNNVVM